MSIKAMKQALKALETAQGYIEAELNDRKSLYESYGMDYKYKTEADDFAENKDVITSLRIAIASYSKAIAEAEKQDWKTLPTEDPPLVKWAKEHTHSQSKVKPCEYCKRGLKTMCLCNAQPKRRPSDYEWVGLTDEERSEIINANFGTGLWFMAKDIEAKLKEKNQ